jgi:hypothetical protein
VRQIKELALIDFYRLVALNEATELGLLLGYDSLRNISSAKSNLKFCPGDDSTRR